MISTGRGEMCAEQAVWGKQKVASDRHLGALCVQATSHT